MKHKYYSIIDYTRLKNSEFKPIKIYKIIKFKDK